MLITKLGYELVSEAVCNGTSVLLPLEDWPEIRGWRIRLAKMGEHLRLTDEKILYGDFLEEVREVLAMRACLVKKRKQWVHERESIQPYSQSTLRTVQTCAIFNRYLP